ncbi:hypothetical protein [Rhodococcoides kyotonense]|uniref:Uncharacterized protein n=1 Tax=Rhodococcoides kyotonense TaxID=398843 RepID=A0A239FT37_9NOCA|nr:hypothetical protein [Rhodococcus kyotonensis]SNS59352.1 hypothetical protein SAMN05421642_103418 [Rhodococcus kyotonensis]
MADRNKSRRATASVQQKQERALALLLEGKTNDEIAKAVGYRDRSGAHRAITAALERHAKTREDLADQALTIIHERLEKLLSQFTGQALMGDVQAGNLVLKIIDRYAKLYGADAPTKIDATITTRSEIDDQIEALMTAHDEADRQRSK